ncbi:MAG: alpha/beta fold hydrolase [Streptosporangiaceae bacterium]
MSADDKTILADMGEMLRAISDGLLPGEEVTGQLRLVDDLGLQSINLVNLSGRLQSRYGSGANLLPLLVGPGAPPLGELRVADLVDYLVTALERSGPEPAGQPGGDLETLLTRLIGRATGHWPAADTFGAAGLTEADMARVTGMLEARLGPLGSSLLDDAPTVADLARSLEQRYGARRAAGLLRTVPVHPVPPGAPAGAQPAGAQPAAAASGAAASWTAADETAGRMAAADETAADETAADETGADETAGRMAAAERTRPRNDNVAVLREHAPGTVRTLLRLPEGDVEVFTAGDGPALVLMHPVNVGAGAFARLFASMAGSFRLVCMHHPGVGATTWDDDLTLSGLAQLHRTVLAELFVPPPYHVLGSSFGGLVAQQFALLYPEECASLVLAGCSYQASARPAARPLPVIAREEFDAIRRGGADQRLEGSPGDLAEFLLRCESMAPGAGLRYLDAFATRPTLYSQLPGISVPALILHGCYDTLTPARDPHVLYGAIPQARLIELPDAGHFPYLTHPAAVSGLLLPFLDACAQGQRPDASDPIPRPAPARSRGTATRLADPPPLDPCTIIISSGRCGSTLLSTLIEAEPQTLSVSESLASIRAHMTQLPATAQLTGAQYWSLLSDRGEMAGAMAGQITVSEFRYPASGRFASDPAGIPPILYVTLPGASSDPDLLYSVLADMVPRFPAQPIGLHHKMLMDLMAVLAGRRRWVERSGGSSSVAEPLLATFPDTRIVYLTRDIADTARSMSRHVFFQLAAVRHEFILRFGTDPYSPWPRPELLPPAAELPDDIRRLLPDQISAQVLAELGRDTGRFEAMCAYMAGSAEQALADLKPRHLHRMRYEDLVADPAGELTRLGEFIGFDDPAGWARQGAGQVRPPRDRASQPA